MLKKGPDRPLRAADGGPQLPRLSARPVVIIIRRGDLGTRDASTLSRDSRIRAFPDAARRGIRAVAPMTRLLSRMDQSTERARWHGILIGLFRPISWFTFSRHSSISIESTEPVITSRFWTHHRPCRVFSSALPNCLFTFRPARFPGVTPSVWSCL